MRVDLDMVSYRYGRKSWALRDVSLRVEAGVTGLLGPNGAGKTTLLNLLTGITKPMSGTVTFVSAEAGDRVAAQRSVGFLPQRFTFAAEMSCLDAICYAAWVNGRARAEVTGLSRRALELVELQDKAGVRIKHLSGGQRQRLGIAATIAHEPDLVVLDEPTVGLDPGQRLRLRETIRDIGCERPVILSTHLIEDITHVCARVAVVSAGRLAFSGSVDELVARAEATAAPAGPGSAFERAYVQLIDELERVS